MSDSGSSSVKCYKSQPYSSHDEYSSSEDSARDLPTSTSCKATYAKSHKASSCSKYISKIRCSRCRCWKPEKEFISHSDATRTMRTCNSCRRRNKNQSGYSTKREMAAYAHVVGVKMEHVNALNYSKASSPTSSYRIHDTKPVCVSSFKQPVVVSSTASIPKVAPPEYNMSPVPATAEFTCPQPDRMKIPSQPFCSYAVPSYPLMYIPSVSNVYCSCPCSSYSVTNNMNNSYMYQNQCLIPTMTYPVMISSIPSKQNWMNNQNSNCLKYPTDLASIQTARNVFQTDTNMMNQQKFDVNYDSSAASSPLSYSKLDALVDISKRELQSMEHNRIMNLPLLHSDNSAEVSSFNLK